MKSLVLKYLIAAGAIILFIVLGALIDAHTGWDTRWLAGFWSGMIWARVLNL